MNRPLILIDSTGLQAGKKVPPSKNVAVTDVQLTPPARSTYPVSGATNQEAWQDASARGPIVHRGTYAGRYEFDVSVTVTQSENTDLPDSKNASGETIFNVKAEIQSVAIQVTSKISTPSWTAPNAEEQSKWDAESSKLSSHEDDHNTIAVEGAKNILKTALEATPRPSGIGTGTAWKEANDNAVQNAMSQILQPIISKATKEIQAKQATLDMETENGQKPKKP